MTYGDRVAEIKQSIGELKLATYKQSNIKIELPDYSERVKTLIDAVKIDIGQRLDQDLGTTLIRKYYKLQKLAKI